MAKNTMGKTRPKDQPYSVHFKGLGPGFVLEQRVLKHYQSTEQEKKNPYARVFAWGRSPGCPNGELGDVYVSDLGARGCVSCFKYECSCGEVNYGQ